MSLFTSSLSFLTLRPSISEERGTLIIKTGFPAALSSLFLNIRRTEISRRHERITLFHRKAYFFSSSKTLAMDEIAYIDYGFSAIETDWGWTGRGFGAHDQLESYSISLVTYSGNKHFICAFRGEGSVCTGWTGILLGDDSVMDFSGTQDGESRQLANYIASLIGVPVGKPLEHYAEMATCPECNRPTSLYKPKCLYCGAIVNRTEE